MGGTLILIILKVPLVAYADKADPTDLRTRPSQAATALDAFRQVRAVFIGAGHVTFLRAALQQTLPLFLQENFPYGILY